MVLNIECLVYHLQNVFCGFWVVQSVEPVESFCWLYIAGAIRLQVIFDAVFVLLEYVSVGFRLSPLARGRLS